MRHINVIPALRAFHQCFVQVCTTGRGKGLCQSIANLRYVPTPVTSNYCQGNNDWGWDSCFRAWSMLGKNEDLDFDHSFLEIHPTDRNRATPNRWGLEHPTSCGGYISRPPFRFGMKARSNRPWAFSRSLINRQKIARHERSRAKIKI